jgi:hypothetical protein
MAISKYRVVERNQNLWHKLLRLEQAGLTVRQIAKFARVSFNKAERALRSSYYQQWKEDKLNRHITAFDREFAKDSKEQREQLQALIPLSISVYEKAMVLGLQNPAFINAAKASADSVLDRSPDFAKQSNSSQSVVVTHQILSDSDLERARAIARSLRAKQTTPQLAQTNEVITLQPVSTEFTESLQPPRPADKQ